MYIGPPCAEWHRRRRRPVIAIVRRPEHLPGRPVRRRIVVDIGELRQAMPEEHPGAAAAVHLQDRKIVVPMQIARQRAIEIGDRLLPCAVGINRQPDRARLVQARRLLLHQESGVLAPVESTLVPGGPEAALLVAGQAHVRFKSRRVGDARHRAPLAAGVGPHHDVVIAFVVGVPGHVDFARAVSRDGRLPVIGGRRGNFLRRRPGRAIVTARENVGLAIAESLPDQPQVAVRIGGELMVDIGLRIVGEPLNRRPR